MPIAEKAERIRPTVRPSSLAGYEHVRGYGVHSLPFDSGNVLALRVFPQNDFAAYCTVWHCTPDGRWRIYVAAPRLDIACPRYYSSAAEICEYADISLEWTGSTTLRIEMDSPALQWEVTVAEPRVFKVANAITSRIPERVGRVPVTLRALEQLGRRFFDLGDVTLHGEAPNGQQMRAVPERILPIVASSARLDGADLGRPARMRVSPAIGSIHLPRAPTFALGRGYFKTLDPEEYRRTVAELMS